MEPTDPGIPGKRGRKKKKHPGGRPSKFSETLATSLCELLKKGSSRKEACRNLGISYPTMCNWKNRGKRERDLPEGKRTNYFDFWNSVKDLESYIKDKRTAQKYSFVEPPESYQMRKYHDTVVNNSFILKDPTKKQMEFLMRGTPQKYDPNANGQPFEVFFNGSWGSGKTSGLMMAALQYVSDRRYRALLLRPDYRNLEESVIFRELRNWLWNTGARWNEEKLTWKFPSGALLTFSYLHDQRENHKFFDRRYQFIGCDDLTAFTKIEYKKLISLLNLPWHSALPLRIFSTGNAGGMYPRWVKERFITSVPKEMARYNRYTVSAGYNENPHLNPASVLQLRNRLGPDSFVAKRLLDLSWDLDD